MDRHEKEFLELIEKHQNIIHKICLVYCRTQEDKQDMHQEIILQLWKSYPSFNGQSAFSTWMYRVALNTALTMVRKPKLALSEKDISNDLSYSYTSQIEKNEDLMLLYKAIGKLKKIEKAIVLLWLEDKPYEEIADAVGMTVKNVSVKLVRVKATLEKLIKGMV